MQSNYVYNWYSGETYVLHKAMFEKCKAMWQLCLLDES